MLCKYHLSLIVWSDLGRLWGRENCHALTRKVQILTVSILADRAQVFLVADPGGFVLRLSPGQAAARGRNEMLNKDV